MSTLRNLLNSHSRGVIVFSVLVIVCIVSLISFQILSIRRANAFSNHLHRFDGLVSQNRTEESRVHLQGMLENAQKAEDFLILISRASEFVDRSLYEAILDRALGQFSRNQDLLAIKVNHLLKNDMLYEAAELAEGLSEYPELMLEADLRIGKAAYSHLGTDLPISPEEISDPQSMTEAYLISGDIRYLVNGIVMYAALGNINEAYNIFISRFDLLREYPDAIILLELMIDSGSYDYLESIHTQRENYNPQEGYTDRSTSGGIENYIEWGNLLADLYFARGEIEKSYDIIRENADIGQGNTSINNWFSLVRAHGLDRELPLEIPENSMSLIRHILAQEDEINAFNEAVNYYSSLNPRMDLRWIEELQAFRSSEPNYRIHNSIITLWESINEEKIDASDEYTRNLLLYFLYLNNDIEGLKELVQRYNFERDLAITNFIGYINIVAPNNSSDSSRFKEASELGSFQASFNYGLLELEKANISEASKFFERSRSQLDRQTGFSAVQKGSLYYEDRLRIRLYEGITAVLLGNYSLAQEILDNLSSVEFHHYMLPFLKELVNLR